MELLENCPACGHNLFKPYLVCTDYTVSKKDFNIVDCLSCGLLFTNPRPNEHEIGAYYQSEDYISHSDTKKGITALLYQWARKITLPGKVKLISKTTGLSKGNLVDIGCGTGHFLAEAQKHNWNVLGLEPSPDARKIALNQQNVKAEPLEFLPNIKTKSIDVVTMWHVLEHVHQLQNQLFELNRIIKVGGFAVIALPNPLSIDAKWYGAKWAGYDVPRHLYHFKPNVVRQLFENFSFTHVSTHQMIFDPFYVCLLSERISTSKSNYVKAFTKGVKSLRWAKNNPDSCTSQVYVFQKK